MTSTCTAASATRNDLAQMRKYDPAFSGKQPRY